ncbi:Sensor histidine kinase TmoS [Calycomorphotria hydatis]|uniref:Sensor histidine kinase TmoS n=1 Tax=Calycomorphotria hydatis TaxID=2528027 RepID=A0A517T9G2_9PLAN|nr:Sensor histidine kinase TmoS [Calycomorphotria hydatis]
MVENTPKVLVIEDDPAFRSLLQVALRKEYRVFVAKEGSEGYYKALDTEPDLVVVDSKMPGWNGLETVKMFRSNPHLQHIPIVMLTGDLSRKTIVEAVRLGVKDYVVKTQFSQTAFKAKLHNLLEKYGRLTPATNSVQPEPHFGTEEHSVKEQAEVVVNELIDNWD